MAYTSKELKEAMGENWKEGEVYMTACGLEVGVWLAEGYKVVCQVRNPDPAPNKLLDVLVLDSEWAAAHSKPTPPAPVEEAPDSKPIVVEEMAGGESEEESDTAGIYDDLIGPEKPKEEAREKRGRK